MLNRGLLDLLKCITFVSDASPDELDPDIVVDPHGIGLCPGEHPGLPGGHHGQDPQEALQPVSPQLSHCRLTGRVVSNLHQMSLVPAQVSLAENTQSLKAVYCVSKQMIEEYRKAENVQHRVCFVNIQVP